jgi:hypothetical protein
MLRAANRVTALSYITNASQDRASSATAFTFTSVSLGSENSNRTILVYVFGFRNGAVLGTPTGVTVAGNSATQVFTSTTTSSTRVTLWAIRLPTGTSGNIVVSHGNATTCGIGVYNLITSSSVLTPNSSKDLLLNPTTASPISDSITVSSGAAVIAFTAGVNTINPTWTGVTKDFGTDARSNEWFSGAILYPASSSPVSYSVTNAVGAGIVQHLVAVSYF